MTMDYSPWSEREIFAKIESSNISETGENTPTKLVSWYTCTPYKLLFASIFGSIPCRDFFLPNNPLTIDLKKFKTFLANIN